jgi:hypothetical protein
VGLGVGAGVLVPGFELPPPHIKRSRLIALNTLEAIVLSKPRDMKSDAMVLMNTGPR